jgi:hypothetical protein
MIKAALQTDHRSVVSERVRYIRKHLRREPAGAGEVLPIIPPQMNKNHALDSTTAKIEK